MTFNQGLSQDLETGCPKLPILKFPSLYDWFEGVLQLQNDHRHPTRLHIYKATRPSSYLMWIQRSLESVTTHLGVRSCNHSAMANL